MCILIALHCAMPGCSLLRLLFCLLSKREIQLHFQLPQYLLLSRLIHLLADQVFLNRGNHEDFAICNAYGFQVECLEKYDDITFGMFMEVFQVDEF